MKKSRKKSKKSSLPERKYILFLLGFLLLILLFMFGFYIYKIINYRNSQKFVVESRVENVKSTPDKKDFGIKTNGWIKVQGTNIDYPVYYSLSFNYDKIDYNESFAWTYGTYEELNNIVFISGHNILNLSNHPLITYDKHTRFEQLMSFTYYDFAKDNQFIQYTVNGKDYVYRIFSVSYASYDEMDLYNHKSYKKEEMDKFTKELIDESLYKYDVDVDGYDKVIVLETCTRMFSDNNMHFRVAGRLVRENEKLYNKKVTTTSNYEKVRKITEGGDSYDET